MGYSTNGQIVELIYHTVAIIEKNICQVLI
jgi:hypothetical protein